MAVTEAEVKLRDDVASFLGSTKKLLIGGQWVDSASGKTFATFNPATGEAIADIAEGDKEDVDKAVAAARKAFESGPWPAMKPAERTRLLWRLADLIDENADQLAELETLDNGKPIMHSRHVDVPASAEHFRYMAGWATKLEGNTLGISAPGDYHAYTLREPVGVCGQIIPWNFPLLMAAWKLGAALACGCTTVLKPAEQTPLTAVRLGELFCEAGFPDGVVNIVQGFGETAGASLASHPGVDKVAFTGSTEVGKLIVKGAAGNLKKVSLELGGKAPNIVFNDCDIDAVIPAAAGAVFFNQGEVCCAGTRLFVQKDNFDKVVGGISEIAKNMKVGPGLDQTTEMGPLVSDEQFERVTGYLKAGEAEGARAAAGGHAKDGKGYFVEPTILVDTNPNMKVVREEIFGPVICAMPFNDVDEIAKSANDTNYGLSAGIWTKDVSKAHKLAAKLKAGTVWVNCYNVFDAAMPFGGYKESGWGREMGHDALELYTQKKSVCVAL